MNQKQFHDLLRKYREGKCLPDERKIVDDWFASLTTGKNPFSDAEEEALSKETSWARVEEYIGESPKKQLLGVKDIVFNNWTLIGMAASIIMAGLIFIYMQTTISPEQPLAEINETTESGFETLVNPGTQPIAYSLPDGSKITLKPGSSIRYSKSFQDRKREIFLEGEAFFDVAPDSQRPFLVYTNELTARVLGTSFLVKAYKGKKEVIVIVKTGKVSVYENMNDGSREHQPQEEIILTPNQQVIYDSKQKLTIKKLVNHPEPVIPQPVFKDSYTNSSVIEILNSLEENFGIEIQYDSAVLSNCTLTSDMSHEGFYEQIEILCNALGAQYIVSEDAILIKATGCK